MSFFPEMNIKKKGVVYLIGAGPGDPDLFTIKGKLLLERCDAVVYDNLVPEELVMMLPPEKEKHYVGKKAGRPCFSQRDINKLLASLASSGKNVARLKGGDPFVFGRGGEEANYLRQNNIEYEIVPGVTSGVAAPAYCGIPITDRDRASLVLFVTGHKAREKEVSSVPWDWIAKITNGTVVVYMGVDEIARIVKRLIDSGMSPDTPSAVIERGTFPTQRLFVCSLHHLPQKVIKENIRPPALFVFGEVVNLQASLKWLETRRLLGIRLMVTAPAEQTRRLYRSLRELGAEVLAYPTATLIPFEDNQAWRPLKKTSDGKCWLVFSSGAAVRHFVSQFKRRFGDIRALGGFRIAARGRGTASTILKYGLKPDFIPPDSSVRAFARELTGRIDSRDSIVVNIKGDSSTGALEESLAAAGIKVLPLIIFSTIFTDWPDDFKDRLFENPPHAIIFTSARTVDGIFHQMTIHEVKGLAANAAIISLGASATERLHSMGLDNILEPEGQTAKAMLDLLCKHFGNRVK